MAFNLWSLSSTPTGVETPDVINLRKQQRKEPDRPLYQVLEEKEEKIAPGTLFGTSHTYVINTGTKDKTGAKRLLICTSKFIIFHLNFHPRSVFNQVTDDLEIFFFDRSCLEFALAYYYFLLVQ